VNIDALGCQVDIRRQDHEHKADYLLALKGNQPTLETEVADYFRSSPAARTRRHGDNREGAGLHRDANLYGFVKGDWIVPDRSYPGETHFITTKASRGRFAYRMRRLMHFSTPASTSHRPLSTSTGSPAACAVTWALSSRPISHTTAAVMAPSRAKTTSLPIFASFLIAACPSG
jgi:hypothetical protein